MQLWSDASLYNATGNDDKAYLDFYSVHWVRARARARVRMERQLCVRAFVLCC